MLCVRPSGAIIMINIHMLCKFIIMFIIQNCQYTFINDDLPHAREK